MRHFSLRLTSDDRISRFQVTKVVRLLVIENTTPAALPPEYRFSRSPEASPVTRTPWPSRLRRHVPKGVPDGPLHWETRRRCRKLKDRSGSRTRRWWPAPPGQSPNRREGNQQLPSLCRASRQ